MKPGDMYMSSCGAVYFSINNEQMMYLLDAGFSGAGPLKHVLSEHPKFNKENVIENGDVYIGNIQDVLYEVVMKLREETNGT